MASKLRYAWLSVVAQLVESWSAKCPHQWVESWSAKCPHQMAENWSAKCPHQMFASWVAKCQLQRFVVVVAMLMVQFRANRKLAPPVDEALLASQVEILLDYAVQFRAHRKLGLRFAQESFQASAESQAAAALANGLGEGAFALESALAL